MVVIGKNKRASVRRERGRVYINMNAGCILIEPLSNDKVAIRQYVCFYNQLQAPV